MSGIVAGNIVGFLAFLGVIALFYKLLLRIDEKHKQKENAQ